MRRPPAWNVAAARRIACAVALAACVLTLAACGDERQARTAANDLAATLPHLGDLPEGYRVGDDSGCGAIGAEGASPALLEVVASSAPGIPELCVRELVWAWSRPRTDAPPVIWADIVRWPDAEIARRGFAVMSDVSQWANGTRLAPTAASAGLGDESATFTSDTALVAGRPGAPASAVGWREGAVTGLAIVAGGDDPVRGRLAGALARTMLERLHDPIAPSEADLDDRPVAIGDPALDVDVWWLGERWSTGSGEAAMRLSATRALAPPGGGPGNAADVEYAREEAAAPAQGDTLHLMMWRPADWARFARTRLGAIVVSPPCATRTEVALPNGAATITVIPEGRPGGGPLPEPDCRSAGGGELAWAVARLDGTVVTVNLPICLMCFSRGFSPDPLDTAAGMRAVLASLVRRPGP